MASNVNAIRKQLEAGEKLYQCLNPLGLTGGDLAVSDGWRMEIHADHPRVFAVACVRDNGNYDLTTPLGGWANLTLENVNVMLRAAMIHRNATPLPPTKAAPKLAAAA